MFNFKDIRPELEDMGFQNLDNVYWNASTPHLYEQIIRRREGISPTLDLSSYEPVTTWAAPLMIGLL